MTSLDSAAVVVPLVLLLASTIRSAFGFGEALIAVPLLALVVPVEIAAPVAVLASITVALIAVLQDWRHIHVRSAGWLVLATLAGIPLGLLLLKAVAGPIVKGGLGLVILAFSLYSLLVRRQGVWTNDRLAWIFGFFAGVLGGAYGMNGPPLVIYGSLRGWSPQHFRATLQGYFLPASVIGMAGYLIAGLWTPQVTRFYLLSLPGVLIGTFAGRWLNHRLNATQFLFYVQVGLVLLGGLLVTQAVLR